MNRVLFSVFIFLSTSALALPPGISLSGGEVSDGILKDYDVRNPPVIQLAPESKLIQCSWMGKVCSGKTISLVMGRAPEQKWESGLSLSWKYKSKKESFQIDLPDAFPWMKQIGKSALKNDLMFSVSSLTDLKFSHCHLFILSPLGEIKFYRSIPKECHDFRPHKLEGRTYYSYAEMDETINYVGYIGPRVILDEQFQEVKKVAFQNDMHDFLLLGLNHWVGFEFVLGRLGNGKPYLNKRLREWKDGKMIFDWGASDLILQFKTEATTNIIQTSFRGEVVAELYHMNSIQRLKDGSFFVGLGHDGAGVLDPESGKMKWILGGLNDSFGLTMHEHPLFNHTPLYNEKTKTIDLFSNRSWGVIGTSPARILKYRIDPDAKKLLEYKIVRVRDEFIYVMGSLQIVDGISSIGFGSKNIASMDFLEFSSDKKDNWKITFEKMRTVYRFYREPYGE